MQLSETEAQQLDAILDQYDRHPAVQQMRQYIQHGSVTTYEPVSYTHLTLPTKLEV